MIENPEPGRGFVYIFSNPAMPGLLKIGYTTRSPNARAAELSKTEHAADFRVQYYNSFKEPYQAEQFVHRRLSQYRYNKNREYFTCDIHTAIKAIESASSERFCEYRSTEIEPTPEPTEYEKYIQGMEERHAASAKKEHEFARLREQRKTESQRTYHNKCIEDTKKAEDIPPIFLPVLYAICFVAMFYLYAEDGWAESGSSFFNCLFMSVFVSFLLTLLLFFLIQFLRLSALWLDGKYVSGVSDMWHPGIIWVIIIPIGYLFYCIFS